MQETTEFIMSPKVDYCFKELMKNPKVRKGFIGAIFNIDPKRIASTKLLPTDTDKDGIDDKYGVMDVLVELVDGRKIDMEMQIAFYVYWDKRVVYYLSKMVTSQIKKGQDYDRIEKCIHVGILDFELNKGYNDFYSRYHLREDKRGDMFSDVLEVHIIELPKIKKYAQEDSALLKWGSFFNGTKREEFMAAAKGNEYIEEAFDEIVKLSKKEEQRIAYERRQKVLRDHNSFINGARIEGIAIGKTEGIAIGRTEGIAIGKTEGIVIGKTEGRTEIIENALRRGKSPEEIAEFNGISLDEIKKVQETLLAEA